MPNNTFIPKVVKLIQLYSWSNLRIVKINIISLFTSGINKSCFEINYKRTTKYKVDIIFHRLILRFCSSLIARESVSGQLTVDWQTETNLHSEKWRIKKCKHQAT